MKISWLHLVNFRCFKEFDMDFHTQGREVSFHRKSRGVGPLTAIVAKNGHGKTTVLDALRIALGTFTSAFDYPSPKRIEKKDIHIDTPENTLQSILSFPVEVHAKGEIEGESVSWSRELPKENGKSSIRNAKAITEYGKKLKDCLRGENGDQTIIPLVAFYGTGRLWKDHRYADKERPLLRPRDFGYDYALGDDSNYLATYLWLTNAIQEESAEQIYSIRKDEVLAGQLAAIRGALCLLLEEEGYQPLLHINQKFKTLAILAPSLPQQDNQAPHWSLPISLLSDGVRCALSLFLDIAFRCAKLNPALGKEACEKTHGIVLIDEVDLHLHPAWQQKILDTLQFTFPNLQFIVTTHSPQVISSIPRECVRILCDGQTAPLGIQTQGVEVGDILTGIFGTYPTPLNLEIVKKLNRLDAMVYENQYDTEEWQALYRELVNYYGENYGPLEGIVEHKNFLQRMAQERNHA